MQALGVIGLLIVVTQPAYAYLDPGTGSIILQAALSVIFGGLVFFKNIRTYIAAKLGLYKNKGDKN